MPVLDDINEKLRDFVGWNAQNPLPIGDPRTGVHNLSKKDIRDVLLAILQANGNPDALEAINTRGVKFCGSRADAAATVASLSPAINFVFAAESPTVITLRARYTSDDDPLVPAPSGGVASWGIYHRFQRYQDVIMLSGVSGTATAYTATSPAGLTVTGNRTLLTFIPHVTNSGLATLSINGGPARNILGADGGFLAPNTLIKAGRYLLMDTGFNYLLIGVPSQVHRPAFERDRNRDIAIGRWRHDSSLDRPLSSGGTERAAILLNGSPRTSWIASLGDGDRAIVASGGTRWVDLQFLPVGDQGGRFIRVRSGATARLILPTGTRTVVGPAAIRVYRPLTDDYVFEVIEGSVSVDSGGLENVPARDFTIINAGQSLAVQCFTGGGLFGLQRALADVAGWRGSIWAVQGATGATGLTTIDGSGGYWWDHVGNGPGPAALTWKAALDSIPAGQPRPSAIYWCFGQDMAYSLGNGALTPANAQTWLTALFAWMRDQIDPVIRTPIILSPVGTGYALTSDQKISRLRQIELQLIASDPAIHLGPSYFDLPRRHKDVHMREEGQMLQGYRLGVTFGNLALARNDRTGPYVSRIEELNGGLTYRLTIERPGDLPIALPALADGIAVLPSGVDLMTANPLQVEQGGWGVAAGKFQYTITLTAASPGATVMWPYGMCEELAADRYIRDDRPDLGTATGNYWPLRPFCSPAFS